MKTTVGKVIRKPPKAVFDYIADMRNDVHWAPLVSNVQQIAGDGPGEGAKWRFTQRVGSSERETEFEMVTYQRPALLQWRREGKVSYESTMMFAPHKYGTAISQTNIVDTGFPWYKRIPARIYSGMILRKQMKNLAKVLENQPILPE